MQNSPICCACAHSSDQSRKMKTFKLDRVFFRRFITLLKMMFPKIISASVFLAVYILAASVLDQVLTYYVGVLPSEFYVALGNRNRSSFNTVAWKSVCVVFAKCLIMKTVTFASGILYVVWRRLICQQIHALYFKGFAYYELNVLRKEEIDNVDQRITQDVDKTCRVFGDIFARLLISPFIIGYYTYLTFKSSGYLGPVIIYLYFIVGTVINRFLMTPIISLVVEQEKQEGNFRFKHVAVRSHAEAIGFFQSGLLENYLTNERLDALLNTQQRLVSWQFPLNFSTSLFDYFGSIISYLVIAMAVFVLHSYDDVDPVDMTGIVSRNSFYYMYLINSFSSLIDLSSKVSDMAGTTHRVAELVEFLKKHHDVQSDKEDNDDLTKSESHGCGCGLPSDNPDSNIYFSLNLVSYKAPGRDNFLIHELTFNVAKGTRLLITGESSSGKTSILRVICGLWKAETGVIFSNIMRSPRNIIFLPQKPYFPGGSLRQQVVYPYRAGYIPSGPEYDAAVVESLFAVRLDHLIERCGGLDGQPDEDWTDALSPGEMQRLSISRIFFHRPDVVLLDEVTSAVGSDMEDKIYTKLYELGITYVTIGHRRTLRMYHTHRLHLDGLAGWTISEIVNDPARISTDTSSVEGNSSLRSSGNTIARL